MATSNPFAHTFEGCCRAGLKMDDDWQRDGGLPIHVPRPEPENRNFLAPVCDRRGLAATGGRTDRKPVFATTLVSSQRTSLPSHLLSTALLFFLLFLFPPLHISSTSPPSSILGRDSYEGFCCPLLSLSPPHCQNAAGLWANVASKRAGFRAPHVLKPVGDLHNYFCGRRFPKITSACINQVRLKMHWLLFQKS